jgi:excisionase family DNA binding protein
MAESSEKLPDEPGPSYLSTAQVAQALGVGVSTVKRWVDEGILPAHRTAGGHRKLLKADVIRLARDGDFPALDLGRLHAAAQRHGPPDPAEMADRLVGAMEAGDGDRVRALILGAYQAGMAIDLMADAAIAPAMQRIGHGWEVGRLDVMHEHRGTQLCTAALYELRSRLEAQAARDRPVAVGGAPERDYYIQGSQQAEMVLLDAGWKAVNLGPHTPIASFREAVDQWRPRLLWLSIGHLVDRERFLAEYPALYREAERAGVAVAVGGRALTDEVRRAMVYTTYGDGLRHLAAFARTLHRPPRPPRRGRPPGKPGR